MQGIGTAHGTLRFGPFEADLLARELRKQGVRIKVPDQSFRVLGMLLECPGKLVSREALQQQIWPSDTFVDFEQGLNNSVKRLREALGDSAEMPQYIETLPRRGYRFIAAIDATSRRIQSLAVLPLEDLSHNREQEYFAEGLTEALITTLAKIGELRVISRTSVMQYQGVRKPLSGIARELGVDAIVEGTVLRAGDRVRITAQLIDTPVETHLWAETYERDMRDILALQSEVAQAIAREIRIKLTPVDEARLAKSHLVNPEAYEAYLKGRYYWNRRSGQAFGKAIQSFKTAIAKDPSYAAAFAGLADCLSAMSGWGFASAEHGSSKAKELSRTACELDPSSAEVHTSFAFATFFGYDFQTAEQEFERSLELNPRYATAHHWFGFYLGCMGRHEEAYTEFKRALRLDPCSGIIQTHFGFAYVQARRYKEAIELLDKTIELDPAFAPAHCIQGLAYMYEGMHEPAIAAMHRGIDLAKDSSFFITWLAEAFAAGGHAGDAQRTLEHLRTLSEGQYVSPYFVSHIYAALDKSDDALHWLDAAYAEKSPHMVYLKIDPRFDNLRSDPRFQDIFRRMNFPA